MNAFMLSNFPIVSCETVGIDVGESHGSPTNRKLFSHLHAEIVPPGQGHKFWSGFFPCNDLDDFVIQRSNP